VVVREMNVNGWDDADLACPYVDAAA
jgi:hypothetical protein